MLPGETIHTGASMECPFTEDHPTGEVETLEYSVMSTPAGYYWGTSCQFCGPFSRESDYYKTREQAEADPDYQPRS